ncbi:hypothetical protein [Amycolatopsis sp. CA-230715]|uniref:hypothetical protein n=1 Tax=Amycolatopsis sp. CA-230715 TaxID=2745196 RepID=UPI001C0263A7|nr:hypothetical protein [Amycolatopsis sp. CA-230715]QWF81198.1 hypothetical protein HUW46_04624 [Amycolatopsis sp. CA-230715]
MTGELTFGGVVRSEWTKLVSLLANRIALVMAPVTLIGLAGVIGWHDRARPVVLSQAIGGGFLPFVLLVGVFGALMLTGEHGSGLLRSTLVAVPKRLPVLWAKALVLVAVTTPVAIVTHAGAFLAYQAFSADPIPFGEPRVLMAILGAAGGTVAAGLLGLGIGTVVRDTATAIVTYVAALVLLPQLLLGALPDSLRDAVLTCLPTTALRALFGADVPIAPGIGALVVLAWVALALGGGAVALRRRDAF